MTAQGPSPSPPPAAAARGPEPLLPLLAEAVPVMLAYFDAPALRCVFANERYARSLAHTSASIVGRTVQELAGERMWQLVEPHLRQTLAGHAVQYTREHLLPDGQCGTMEISLVPHLDTAGSAGPPTVQGLFILGQDITQRQQAERAVRESDERMRKFSDATEEGIAFHADGFITDCNEAMLRLVGHTREEVVGRPMLDFIQPSDQDKVQAYMAQGREDLYEVNVRHKSGHALPLEVMGKTLPQEKGGLRVVVARDTSARRQAQARMEFLALHDSLTQLPNRQHLMQHLGAVLAHAQAHAQRVALLFLDLDHFKTVNESLGHEAGDQLLCEVARRLAQGAPGLPGAAFCARVGGDQFVVVLPGLAGREQAAAEADALLARVRGTCVIQGTPLSVSPSIGITLYPEDGLSADDLLHRAATALQHAKESGRGARMLYTPAMEGQPAALLRQEHLLREAVLRQSFVLHYQPQIEVEGGRLHGFEALVRWQHPEQGLVGPGEFIALAESRGLIGAIGRWVLREACRQMQAWHDSGLPRVRVAVNLSAIEFRQRDVVDDIAQALHECGLAPHYLEVEITESALMHDADRARATLTALQQLGVAVTVDDFGTGYSSLSYLKRYPLNKIKVDRSFVMDTPGDSDDVAIVTAVVQLARSLQLQSVAEGVETEEQMQLLRRLGCELAQGFGISRPLPAAQAEAWMRALPA